MMRSPFNGGSRLVEIPISAAFVIALVFSTLSTVSTASEPTVKTAPTTASASTSPSPATPASQKSTLSKSPTPAPQLLSSAPLPGLTKQFERTRGWTGSDSAYSIKLSPNRTLWLFGDTFIGDVRHGKRTGFKMITNSFAWQSLDHQEAPLQFFWAQKHGKPAPILSTNSPDRWFWPGDGAMIDGKLYLFLHEIGRQPGNSTAFGFQTLSEQIMQIDNPLDPPASWRTHKKQLPPHMGFGNAVFFSPVDGYLYMFCEHRPRRQLPSMHNISLARWHKDALKDLNLQSLEYWCSIRQPGPDGASPAADPAKSAQGRWTTRLENPMLLIPDAAQEMTVSEVPGIQGFVATYTPIGMGDEVAVRRADNLTGPWSAQVKVFKTPLADRSIFSYSAKAHPELSKAKGELVVTYCQNTVSLQSSVDHPKIYQPRAVLLKFACP